MYSTELDRIGGSDRMGSGVGDIRFSPEFPWVGRKGNCEVPVGVKNMMGVASSPKVVSGKEQDSAAITTMKLIISM